MEKDYRLYDECIARIKTNSGIWKESRRYGGRLVSRMENLQDLKTGHAIIEHHLRYLNHPRRRSPFKLKVVGRAKLTLERHTDALIQQSVLDQQLYIDRHDKISRYRYDARFKLTPNIISKVEGYEKLLKYGMFSSDNPEGVVMDHRVSVKYGFDNNIPPEIIGHYLNCEFLQEKENLAKSSRCSLDIKQLKHMIYHCTP